MEFKLERESGISLVGFKGTWYVVDQGMFTKLGQIQPMFLLESEQEGDEAPHVIVDKNLAAVVEESYNGFLDLVEEGWEYA